MEQPRFQSFCPDDARRSTPERIRPFAQPPSTVDPVGGRANLGADRLAVRAQAAGAHRLDTTWQALHEAARAVALLAGRAPEPMRPDVRNFPAIMRATGGWRAERAEQGIEDLAAILQPGLAALIACRTAGQTTGKGCADPPALAAAAEALWLEFEAAQAALIDLVPPLNLGTRA